jgi:hypothetical protein
MIIFLSISQPAIEIVEIKHQKATLLLTSSTERWDLVFSSKCCFPWLVVRALKQPLDLPPPDSNISTIKYRKHNSIVEKASEWLFVVVSRPRERGK